VPKVYGKSLQNLESLNVSSLDLHKTRHKRRKNELPEKANSSHPKILNLIGRRFSQMNTDKHFLWPILINRIHPAQKAIFHTIKFYETKLMIQQKPKIFPLP
jgi:hypothetical protein